MDTPEPPSGPPEQEAWPPASGAPTATTLATSGALTVPNPSGPPSPPYPVTFEISDPGELSRWLPFIKWLLVIPHLFALVFVGIGALFVSIFAWFAVLFTARFPRGAFDYMVGTFRWGYRVAAYYLLMTDAYPPFSLADDPSYPVRVNVEYPERIARWRPIVQWLLVVPYLFIAGLLYWLTTIMVFFAFFTIVFTKRIPRGMFELMVPGLRWNLRGTAYHYFLTDRYPPFVWG